MYQFIVSLLQEAGLEKYADIIACAVCIIAMTVISVALRCLLGNLLNKVFNKISERKKIIWIEVLLQHKFFSQISNLAIPVTVSAFTSDISGAAVWRKAVEISLVITILLILDAFTKSIVSIYSSYEVSRTFPINGLMQVIKIVIFVICGIVIISILVDKSPAVLIGGIGAMTAITSIVFKDAILGFVAGIQLTGNDMIRIGDWVELPKHSANGTVINLSMTTVKVENFDKTITLVPAYTLVSESFINWRAMVNTGARRIKRCIFIDASGVCICGDEMTAKFQKIDILKDYINGKLTEIEKYNQSLDCDLSELTNGRRMTNIGVFRAYITCYLKHHSGINKNLVLMTRQLEPGEKGIPMEIYAFANTAVWTEYENIQSDIFDHIYAVISEFGLKLYQNPSGNDISRISDLK